MDGAEDDPQGAAEVNVGGTAHAAELGAPIVAYSTDYVFDGRKGAPYLESDSPSPQSAYGMTKLHGEAAAGERAWVIRSSWLFGPTGHNFVRTMLRLGAERDEVAVVADQRGCPTYVGHLATATRELVDAAQPFGLWHVAAGGDCTWADFAEAIFEEAGLACRVRRITTAEFGARAPRPAVSILRSEKGAPELPHWRDGLDRVPRRDRRAGATRRCRVARSPVPDDVAARCSVEPVWDAVYDTDAWPPGGRACAASIELVARGEDGIGGVSRFTFRSVLPYDLVFEMRSVRVERPGCSRASRRASSPASGAGDSSRTTASRPRSTSGTSRRRPAG